MKSQLTKYNFSRLTELAVLRVLLFGFASGMSLLLSGNTLNFWLSTIGLSPITIGAFSLVALPYAFKFAWAPVIDRVEIPFLSKRLGRRKAWLCVSHIGLVTSLTLLGHTHPGVSLIEATAYSFLVAFFAMSQDVTLDAFRIDSLTEEQQGPGASMYSVGYRFGMLWSGAGAIYLSAIFDWHVVYNIMALSVAILSGLMLIGASNETLTPEAEADEKASEHLHFLYRIFIEPFTSIANKKEWALILLFLVLYRMPDYLITAMANPFLLSIGYSEIEIATAHKLFGTAASIAGGLLSLLFMPRFGLKSCLLGFGAIHICAHFFFFIQYLMGYHMPTLYLLVAAEHITGGMAMAAYIGYISSLCKGAYTGTQYALLSSMMGISRVIFPAASGFAVVALGWGGFFLLCVILSLPALVLLGVIKADHAQEN